MTDNSWNEILNQMEENTSNLYEFDILNDDLKPHEKIADFMKSSFCNKRAYEEISSNDNTKSTNNQFEYKKKVFKIK